MKYLLLLAALHATPLWASDLAAVTPDPRLGHILSPNGPLTQSQLQQLPPQTADRHSLAATYTYLRCWYRVSSDPLQPKSTYEWAQDASGGGWYRLYGNWWHGGTLSWENMFYSDVSQDSLQAVCRQTLADKGIKQPVLAAQAADNQLSFNHTVWSNDSPAQHGINKLISFGDSLSDTQNMFNGSLWRLPNSSSWMAGRFSNGRVWPEYVAGSLGLPLYNWAVGGAAADRYLVVPGVLQQVQSWQTYMRSAPDYQPGNTLFSVLVGANDLMTYGRSVDQVMTGLRQALELLIGSGARNILLLNLPDISRAPEFRLRSDGLQLAAQVRDYNQRLNAMVSELQGRYGSTLILRQFDSYAVFNELLAEPARFGINNIRDACLAINTTSAVMYAQPHTPQPACQNPGQYLFWDMLHPTTHTHQLLAERVTAFVRQQFGNLPQ